MGGDYMKKHIPLIVCWLINSLIILLVSNLLPNNVVLGNGWIKPIYAAFWMGLLLTVLDHVAKHANKMRLKLKGKTTMVLYYAMANTVFFWLLARLPELSGYGISVFYLAILMGVLVTIVQWIVRRGLKKVKLI